MQNPIKYIASAFILLLSYSVVGQNNESNCLLKFKEAEKLYEQGKLETIPSILQECLKSGFNNEEKVQAYRLLVLTYLFDDKKELAEQHMELMLSLDPEHQINETIDPIEYIYLHEQFNTNPIATYGLSGGINACFAKPYETFSLGNSTDTSIYSTRTGFNVGIDASISLVKNLYADFGLRYKNTQLLHTNSYTLNNFDNSVDTLDQFGKVINQETHNWLRLPVGLTYKIPLSDKLSAHIKGGASLGYLLSSSSTFNRSYVSEANLASVSGPQENMNNQRNTFNYWAYGGLGISYQIPLGNIFLDVRYNYGLRNITNENNRYSNSTILYKYLYVDDNLKLDDLSFTIGYSKYIYNPKKMVRKNKKTAKNASVNMTGSKRNKDLQ